jgi:hypothetical protein
MTICSPPLTAESGESSPTSLSEVAWIAGTWIGGAGDSFIEERWSQPVGGEMIGTFRMLESGEPVFYEFMRLATEPAGVVLQIKHFGADLTAWEDAAETVDFELDQATDNRAVFVSIKDGLPETLTYRRTNEGLEVTLDKPAEGSTSTFAFRRP